MATVPTIDPVLLDETATPTTLTPRRAWAPRGERAIGRVPRRRRQHVSWLATLTPAGIGPSVVVDGTVDRLAFEAFVAQVLVPALRPGQVVVLDNLGVHRSATARRPIEAAGCRLVFLPTSSPDLNPIEQAFAKGKQTLRRLAPRPFDAVVEAVGRTRARITPADAASFFRAAGYPL